MSSSGLAPLASSPRVAIGSWAFSFGPYEAAPWTFDRFVEFARENAYDGVEINGFRPHPHDEDYAADEAVRVAERVRDAGLGIAGFAPDLRSTPPAEVDTEQYLQRIRSIAAFCDAAQIDRVRIDTITPADGLPVATTSDAYRRLVHTFRAAASELEQHGIGLIWEFEPGFWINRASEVVRLLQDVDHPNFGFLFDSSHAHTSAAYGRRQGADPEILDGGAVEFAALVAPWVHHLHLIDSDGTLHDEETSVHMPFGVGEIDFAGPARRARARDCGSSVVDRRLLLLADSARRRDNRGRDGEGDADAFIGRLGSGH